MNNIKLHLLLFLIFVPVQIKALTFTKNKDYIITNTQSLFSQKSDYQNVMQEKSWEKFTFYRLPNREDNFWLRFDVILNEPNINGIILSGLFSAEIYWDGHFVGQKGIVGINKSGEVPGEIDTHFLIPSPSQKIGLHTVYLRVSRHHLPWALERARSFYEGKQPFDFFLDDYRNITQTHFSDAFIPFISLGAFLVVGLYFFGIYHRERQHKKWLIFSILCISVAAVLIVESWRGLFGYQYDLHVIRLQLVAFFTSISCWLLVAFLSLQYQLKYRYHILSIYLGIIFLINFFIPSYDISAALLLFISILFIIIFSTRRYFKLKKSYDLLMMLVSVIGMILLIVKQDDFTEMWFFFVFSGIMSSILMMLAEHNENIKASRDTAIVERERLRTELMRRHIQPHFVMNTLTSICEWIEEEPDSAIDMINNLADEFRTLSQMLDKAQVPMAQEMELCQAHLSVMSYRQRIKFELNANSINQDALIPPGLIHTLIENAISHNIYKKPVTFELLYVLEKGRQKYIFLAPMSTYAKKPAIGLGTGGKYLKASLDNCYNNKWSIEEKMEKGFFKTTLILGSV